MRLPIDVGAEWEAFVAQWCLGVAPAETRESVGRSFQTLRRLWPEEVARMEATGVRGPAVVAPLVHLGLILADTEELAGFGPVFQRVKSGEPSAAAELKVGAIMARLGLTPTLEPPMGGNVLDCKVMVDGRQVFIEVISPENSQAMRDLSTDAQALAALLLSTSPLGATTEGVLTCDSSGVQEQIAQAVSAIPVDGEVHEIEGIGKWIRALPPSTDSPVSPRALPTEDRPYLGIAQAIVKEGMRTMVSLRSPMTDERLKRLLTAELHHFSRDEANVVIVRLTDVAAASVRGWGPLVEHWFGPNQNTRVGGVALYEEALVGIPQAIRTKWRLITNPYARTPLPLRFVSAIAALDEGVAWNVVPHAGPTVTPLLSIPGIGVLQIGSGSPGTPER